MYMYLFQATASILYVSRDEGGNTMHRSGGDSQRTSTDGLQTPRRGFLKAVASLVGAIAAWRSEKAIRGDDVAVASAPDIVTSPKYPTLDFLPKEYQGYPHPTYSPQGYGLAEIYIDRPDGFGGPGELAFWYVNRSNHVGLNNPLAVYVARQPQLTSLHGNREGQPAALAMVSGETVQAKYHDGFWVLAQDQRGPLPDPHFVLPNGAGVLIWETSNVHSLTFHLQGYTIFVRGSRLAGVSFEELLRVANSITS